jgi:hypothetical protein
MNQATTIESTKAPLAGELQAWRRALCTELFTLTSPLRAPSLKRRARDIELSIAVVDYGLHKLEGTGMTLAELPLGDLLRAAGYDVTSDLLPHRGSLLDW